MAFDIDPDSVFDEAVRIKLRRHREHCVRSMIPPDGWAQGETQASIDAKIGLLMARMRLGRSFDEVIQDDDLSVNYVLREYLWLAGPENKRISLREFLRTKCVNDVLRWLDASIVPLPEQSK